jgi:hypothetical protein
MRVEFAASTPEDRGCSDALPLPKASRLSAPRASPESRQQQEMLHLAQPPERSLSIRVDKNKRIVYQIIDERTGEVVRQIPPEEVRRASRNIAELLRSSEDRERRQIDIDT